MDFETLAARALNASRIIHKPTYGGLRVLLAGLAKNKAAFNSFLARRCLSRSSWRYMTFEVVKEAATNKPPTYRTNCITGSPLTTLAEAYVLSLMAGQSAFAVPPCAYSYLWPDYEMAGRNYAHFVDGYERRNRRVAELLSGSRDLVAVVTDIKSFYPSVDRQRLREKVAARVDQVKDPTISGPIRKFSEAFLSLSVPRAGIPVGPEFSHVFGHLALDKVDTAMMTRYGDRYLRYVDDIIVVCSKSETSSVLAHLRQLLEAEGLVLNDAKEDQIESSAWERECVSFTSPNGESFESLLDSITSFLIWNPERGDSLHKRFRNEGFSLPIARLRSLSRSKRYRAFFGLWSWLGNIFVTEASLLVQARSLRSRLLAQMERLAQDSPPSAPMSRRWYSQKRRFTLNRLLYLLPPQEYSRLLELTPDIDEFVEIRVVTNAIRSGDATALLKYPGRAVSTFCQLWPEHHSATPTISWPKPGTRADAESASHLGLFLSVVPPENYLHSLDETLRGYRILIDLCSTGTPDRGKIDKLSFLDELDLLYSTLPHGELVGLIASRFDELEDVGFEGLELGSGNSLFSWDGSYTA